MIKKLISVFILLFLPFSAQAVCGDITFHGLQTDIMNACGSGSHIDNTPIGATTPSTGAFTTGTFTGLVTISTSANGGLTVTSTNTSGPGLGLVATTGHSMQFFSTGSANVPGWFGVYDATRNNTPFAMYGGSSQTSGTEIATTSTGVFGFSSNNAFATSGSLVAGMSLDTTGVIDFGNGTQGDKTAILKAASLVPKRTAIADAAYTVLATDSLIVETSLTSGRTITLPTASTVIGQYFIIKDESGSAGTSNITVAGTIDGGTNKIINSAYGTVRVYSNGTVFFTW